MADTTRPNVLLVLTDQERHDLVAPDGVPVETEAIDGLAADGVRFSHAFTPISICSSARASLLTGLYPHNHGILNNVHEPDAVRTDLAETTPTFGRALREAGYRNAYVGKWHVGRTETPEDFGFDYVGGGDDHHDAHLESGFESYQRDYGVDPEAVEPRDPVYATFGDSRDLLGGTLPIPAEATRSAFNAELTVRRLEQLADGEDPFFHRVDFQGPHHPYLVPEPYASMYDPAALDPWPSDAETFDGKPQVQANYRGYRGVEELDREEWDRLRTLYMGFMHHIDDQIGRILAKLDALGIAENTLVVHASDHGDFTGGHRQWNKGPFMYDDTYRIPLVVRGPGVAGEGRVCDDPVSLMDLMPTFLKAAEEAVPEGLDARSLWPALRNDSDREMRDAVFGEYHGDEMGLYSQRMVRTERYKYVFNAPDIDELYDLDADPAELQNLVDHPDYRDVRSRLREQLAEWMQETGDPIAQFTARHLRGS
ncbi:sulfatase-like hydrolase/transferase [Halomicroarcula sp. F28]|uniref:sulfatase-like hydrolase/transferase n=1 Tax=Haloarcula salinisoli TaxID=2487746 RepID=UPI001C731C35|nr:sulfatase-like hydrolase/transferase [Halomicroarcula salinisoli]MBX0285175.1 sulfatase-like hydrolase/transferase [Halomicroarcula salinisoli]